MELLLDKEGSGFVVFEAVKTMRAGPDGIRSCPILSFITVKFLFPLLPVKPRQAR